MRKYCIYTLFLAFMLNIGAMEKNPELDLSLIWAIKQNNQALALQCISQGTNLNTQDEHGMTALMFAVETGHTVLVKALVEAASNINAQDDDGITALMIAADEGDTEVIKVLTIAGGNVDAQDAYGFTALMYAAASGHRETVKELIAARADVNAQDDNGRTALMHAALDEGKELVKVLIGSGANTNVQGPGGKTALMLAAQYGNLRSVKFLISVEADINIQEAEGSTACMLAAQNGHKEVVKTLIAAGAQYNDKLPNYAEYQAFAAQIKELFACAVDLSIPYYASSTTSRLKPDTLRSINALIKTYKLSLDYIDPQGNTLLHYAVLSGNRVAVSLMLYLMIKHNQFYALEHRARQSHMTPIQIAVTSRAAHLLHPFFNLQLPNNI